MPLIEVRKSPIIDEMAEENLNSNSAGSLSQTGVLKLKADPRIILWQ